MNAYKKLFNNVIVFTIGSLGSKLIAFLLLPLYSFYLSSAEYGTIDLVVTTVSMLLPVVSVCMNDAAVRFAMDKTNNNRKVLTNCLTVFFVTFLGFIFFLPVFSVSKIIFDYVVYLYVLILLQGCYQIIAQFARGIGKSKIFAGSGIILAFFTAIFAILFLVVFKTGLVGYFWAIIIAYIVSLLYLLFFVKPLNYFHFRLIEWKFSRELVTYSLPLIPNYLIWIGTNSVSKYIITFFIGVSATGIFAIGSKIPTMLSVISDIFIQAWQLSVIEEFENNNDKNSNFYNNVFSIYSMILIVGAGIFIMLLKVIFRYLFDPSYFQAWEVVPFLFIGTVFSAFAGFIGQAYIGLKKTSGVIRTSSIAGIISITLSFVLIPIIGLPGAGISSMISFLILFLIRYKEMNREMKLKINWVNFILSILILILEIIVLHLKLNLILEVFVNSLLVLILLFIYRASLLTMLKMIISKFLKRNPAL